MRMHDDANDASLHNKHYIDSLYIIAASTENVNRASSQSLCLQPAHRLLAYHLFVQKSETASQTEAVLKASSPDSPSPTHLCQ